ncbi:hypothetical protein [Thalassotalea ganghwensis]
MTLQFTLSNNHYALKNHWFGDVSLQLYRNGKVIFEAIKDPKSFEIQKEYLIDSPDGQLRIKAISQWTKVSFTILNQHKNEIPLVKVKEPFLAKLKCCQLHIDWPSKSFLSYLLFGIELYAVSFSLWLINTHEYLEGFFLLTLSLIGLLKISIKNNK